MAIRSKCSLILHLCGSFFKSLSTIGVREPFFQVGAGTAGYMWKIHDLPDISLKFAWISLNMTTFCLNLTDSRGFGEQLHPLHVRPVRLFCQLINNVQSNQFKIPRYLEHDRNYKKFTILISLETMFDWTHWIPFNRSISINGAFLMGEGSGGPGGGRLSVSTSYLYGEEVFEEKYNYFSRA